VSADSHYTVDLKLSPATPSAPPVSSGLPPSSEHDKPSYAPPVVTAAIGGALLVTGVVFVAVAAGKDSNRKDLLKGLDGKNATECGAGNPNADRCKEIADASQSAALFRNLAIGSFVGTAAAGVATYLLWPKAKRTADHGVTVVPSYSAADHSFQLGAVGRF
jgi:hypothetical protein